MAPVYNIGVMRCILRRMADIMATPPRGGKSADGNISGKEIFLVFYFIYTDFCVLIKPSIRIRIKQRVVVTPQK